ncbi:hypothetical protein BGZ99_005776 [Dissophora globulifera]|uniref:Uncharacterized protein n=1 Tax=Dissophora globulifera TaxID=979702 RepID=A0A9P6UZX4_9FUNG|nr:hypothetical protein BGZ99_005776 [Dissophora globulifera]
MLSAARTSHQVQNSDGPSILPGQDNHVSTAPALFVASQMPLSANDVMDIDGSLVLLNEMSHCEQDTAPITPSPGSHASSSQRTAVTKPLRILWAKPYVYTANHAMDIDCSFALPNEMSHCEQDTAPITPSPGSHASSSQRTAVTEPLRILWAKPYEYTAKKVDNRGNNATKQLKVAMAEANSVAGL